LVLALFALSATADELVVKEIETAIEAADRTAGRLETMKNAARGLAGLLILLTVATGLMQVFDKAWVKGVTAALAVASTGATLVKQQFYPLDHHTCESAIEELSPVIRETKGALEVYRDEDTSPEDRRRALAYALARKPSLERFSSVFRVSRSAAPPGGFLLMAAQYPQQQSRAPLSVTTSATAVASTKEAAYQHARYLAAERIARRAWPKADADELDRATHYFATQGLANAKCGKTAAGGDQCEITLRIPRDYAQAGALEFLAPTLGFHKSQVVALQTVSPGLSNVSVRVAARSRVDGRFEFRFVREGDTLRLWSIECGYDGGVAKGELWTFDIRLGDASLRLPVNRYFARNQYQIAPADKRILPFSGKEGALPLRIDGRRLDD